MTSPLRKSTLALPALLAALSLGACANSTRVTTGTYAGESGVAAPYLNVGPLIYEVQLSRELNPADTEDASYLQGLTAAQRKLVPGQEWFAVFMQVYNNTTQPHPAASDITIFDTEGTTYQPIKPSGPNEFAYRPVIVPPKGRLPEPDTVAANGPTQGAVLLYKINVTSLDNRPIQVKIVDPLQPRFTAQAELDV
jgi:hypothetical protein